MEALMAYCFDFLPQSDCATQRLCLDFQHNKHCMVKTCLVKDWVNYIAVGGLGYITL